MDAMREALPVVLSRVIGEGPNDDLLSRVWCAQKFAARVDGATWVEWGGALGYDRRELSEVVDENDAEAWTFALGWHLATRREDLSVRSSRTRPGSRGSTDGRSFAHALNPPGTTSGAAG
jgi:hypothetical protein